jgi:hypothetical protein
MLVVVSKTRIAAYSLNSPYPREATLMPTRGARREKREGEDGEESTTPMKRSFMGMEELSLLLLRLSGA